MMEDPQSRASIEFIPDCKRHMKRLLHKNRYETKANLWPMLLTTWNSKYYK